MGADKTYAPSAMAHRGEFAEQFAVERLERVFGKDNVHANVSIIESKDTTISEIDVLVIFGNRGLVLQAKSKRLTLEARKGNDLQIKDDFKKAIQDSYDQASVCARALTNPKLKLVDAGGNEIAIGHRLREIYPICVVADHYPALNFQSRQFLKLAVESGIVAPLVIDVFALDAMTEMLDTPLYFLNYISLRAKFRDKLHVMHELTALSYHLKRNLWLSEQYDMFALEDDVAIDLDVAMVVRRDGLPGERTPEGILTRGRSTTLGHMIQAIEARPDPYTVDLGLLLLTLSEDTTLDVSRAIDKIAAAAKADSNGHDVTFGFSTSGLTIHCNSLPNAIAAPQLRRHCEARKYSQKASEWFGLVIRPGDGSIRFGLQLEFPWMLDEAMERIIRHLPAPRLPAKLQASSGRKTKTGRNEPCPCGSGLKYKKCCLQ